MTQTITRPDDVSEDVWNDFLLVRKAKRAPLTKTALRMIRNEAQKANATLETVLEECILRGWQSFRAEWVPRQETQSDRRSC